MLKSDLESRVGEEKIDVYADLVKKNVEVLKIIEEDGAQWRKLQDEMDKKQENVKRLFRELDGKNLSLKLSAAEVLNIKRKIRNLKKENMHLRDEVQRSLDYEPEIALNRPDLMQMDEEEVRNKVVFIAKAYRDERVRNKNLMKALKMAQSDIANRTRVLASVHKIEEATAEITSQIGMIGHEFQKVGMYREAIRKQEDMILRLEGILKQMTVQTKGLRSETDKYGNEMEENERLKKNLKSYSAPDNTGETKQLRDQVRGLESEIDVLRGQLVSKAPLNAYQSERLGDIAGMQVKLHRAQARVEALENQLGSNNNVYAQQISVLKAAINQKDAILMSIQKQLQFDD